MAKDYSNPWYRDDDQSILEMYDVETGTRTVLAEFDTLIEAPNWTADGRSLVYNSKGRVFLFDLETKESREIDSGFVDNCFSNREMLRWDLLIRCSSVIK